jgi:hypothetical protein
MKVTKLQLKQIIKEEVKKILSETWYGSSGEIPEDIQNLIDQARRSDHPQADKAIEWALAYTLGPRQNLEKAREKLEMVIGGGSLREEDRPGWATDRAREKSPAGQMAAAAKAVGALSGKEDPSPKATPKADPKWAAGPRPGEEEKHMASVERIKGYLPQVKDHRAYKELLAVVLNHSKTIQNSQITSYLRMALKEIPRLIGGSQK